MIIQKKMNEKLLAKQKNTIMNEKDNRVAGSANAHEKKKIPQPNNSTTTKEGQPAPKKP